jgi:hypothetical protein
MRPGLPLRFAALLLCVALGAGPAVGQDRAYLWPGDPAPAAPPYGLLLLGSADPAQRLAAIRAFLAPLGVHDLPEGASQVPLVVPVLPDARAAATGIPTEWSDDRYLDRHWDAERDAGLREDLGLPAGGPMLVYVSAGGALVQDLSAASAFWVRHWILAYRRQVATAPAPAALGARLRETLPDAPAALSRR